jgi:hypothetical protein
MDFGNSDKSAGDPGCNKPAAKDPADSRAKGLGFVLGVKVTDGVYYTEEHGRLVIFLDEAEEGPEFRHLVMSWPILLGEVVRWFRVSHPKKAVSLIRVYNLPVL